MSIRTCFSSVMPVMMLAAALPVTVSNLTTGPQSHVRLTNTASQPVTAWSLAITTKTDASRSHREVETADGLLERDHPRTLDAAGRLEGMHYFSATNPRRARSWHLSQPLTV